MTDGNGGHHHIALASFAPDGSAVTRQWIVDESTAETVREWLEHIFGAPVMESMSDADDVARLNKVMVESKGSVHLLHPDLESDL